MMAGASYFIHFFTFQSGIMKDIITFEYLSDVADGLYCAKCQEIENLNKREKGPPPWIGIRIKEANKLKELAEGLRFTLSELPKLQRMKVYLKLDEQLINLTKADPCLKGHIVTLGPSQPEFKEHFSMVPFHIPISFYKL